MENKNIIIILVAVIVIMAVIAGVMFLKTTNTKDATKVKITSDKSLYKNEKLKILLTDLNKTAISKEKVKITITNKKGKVVVNKTLKTNLKGKANLKLKLKKGKYNVNVTYNGNENYTGNNTTQKLTMKEKAKKTQTKNYPLYNPDLGYYRSTGMGGMEWGVVELADGRYVVVAGDGYYEYVGLGADGYPITSNFLGHGGQRIY